MGVIICNNGDCCGNEYILKNNLMHENENESKSTKKHKNNESTCNLNKCSFASEGSDSMNENAKNESINIVKKQQIVVIIVTGKSYYSTQITVNDHIEYEVSKFYVVEQMKITAKELKPNAIFQAIISSNKSYRFIHQGFCIFSKGDQGPLYKKMTLIKIDSNDKLLPGNLYYIFAENFNDIVVSSYESSTQTNKKKGL